MSTRSPSRSAPKPLSLADVVAAVAAAELPVRRRQDLASAVRAAARALGRPPEQITADPRLLASRLGEIAPTSLGFSKARWNNIRSLLRAALELVMAMAPGRHLTPLTPAWQALWDQLPTRTLKTRLSRLLHYCSAGGIAPGAVSAITFETFRGHLDLTLLKEPSVVFRDTVSAWNQVRTNMPGWPNIVVQASPRRSNWTLLWSVFPESLKADVMRYLGRLGGGDPMEELPFRPVRPLTLQHREYQIRQFASALVLRGRDASTLTSLADLVAIDTFKDGLRHLLQRRDNRPTATIVHLATSLKAIARHHVRADETQLERLAAIIRKLQPAARGLSVKNRARLRPLEV